MTDVKYNKMRETKNGIVYNTRSISFGKSKELLNQKQEGKNEKSQRRVGRNQQAPVQPIRSLQLKKWAPNQFITSEIAKNKDCYSQMNEQKEKSSSKKRGNTESEVSSKQALQFKREINSLPEESNQACSSDSGNHVLKNVAADIQPQFQFSHMPLTALAQPIQNSSEGSQSQEAVQDVGRHEINLAASSLNTRLYQSFTENKEAQQQKEHNQISSQVGIKSPADKTTSYLTYLEMSSKRKDSFDFKDQTCVFNQEHDFIDQIVTDSLLQKIEDAADCSFESDQLIKKHNHNHAYSAQKSAIQLECREMAPLDKSSNQGKSITNAFQRYPIKSQLEFRGNCLFNNYALSSENRNRFSSRPSNERDYQKLQIKISSFQDQDIKYQTPETQSKFLTFANINSRSKKREESPPKRTVLQTLSTIQKLTFTEQKQMGSSDAYPSTNQNKIIANHQPTFQLSQSYEQALMNNKRCKKAKTKKQQKKMSQTHDHDIQDLTLSNEHPFMRTQVYEIKPFNSLTSFNKMLVQQRNQFSLMGKAKSMDNPVDTKQGTEKQESSSDYAITGEFLQNTVYYREEPKLKSKHNTQALEYPNLDSVETYHYHTQDYARPQIVHHSDNNLVSVEKKFRCSCKNNKCAQGYCDCLKNNEACSPDVCGCTGCENNSENAFLRIETLQKRTKLPEREGCNCKRSKCLKKYCECRQAGLGCSEKCRCYDCLNKVR